MRHCGQQGEEVLFIPSDRPRNSKLDSLPLPLRAARVSEIYFRS